MGGDSQNRHLVMMAIAQPGYQMQVTRHAGSGAYRELAGDMGFRAGRKRGDLLMARAVPGDGTHQVKAIPQTIQRVTGDSPY